jgi:predicted acyl esterase
MVVGAPAAAPPTTQISEIPDKFVMPEPQKDYLKRIEMIPMRDGVRLYTATSSRRMPRTPRSS